MASPFHGDIRSHTNMSSPAISVHHGAETPRSRTTTGDFNESRFNVASSDLPYEESIDGKTGSPRSSENKKPQVGVKALEVVEKQKLSGSRKRWVFFVWLLTFWVPPFVVKWITRSPRRDVREAWREKFAINILIWLSCGAVMFFMVGFPTLICPRQDVYSFQELSAYDGKGKNQAFISMRGVVYDLGSFAPHHFPSIVPTNALLKYAGKDATNLFPVQVSALCNGVTGAVDPAVQLNYKSSNYTASNALVSATDTNAQYHDFRWFTNDSRPDWWYEQQMVMKSKYLKGHIGYTPQYLKTLGNRQNSIASIHGRVYDLTAYMLGGRVPKYPWWTEAPTTSVPNSNFMDDTVVELFRQTAGGDASKYWDIINLSSTVKGNMKACLDNLFYVGEVDTRNSAQCLFAKYLLLAISILLVAVICFKFLAALQFGKKNIPENLDKFIICQVPAYTEDEESLRRAIDSVARMKYDDKRKLLLIICDGMLTGQGNDRPTPQIVLDILGVNVNLSEKKPQEEKDDHPTLSFESLGEGKKQHNMGRVFSGLYEVQGHIVPFLVVVKCGKPSEASGTRPGNRGKRDSQMILMRFLNRIHYNLAMSPMELEMYHQIRNIIGVNPTFYEYCFQIDADTVVRDDSATRMVSAFLQDTRLIGVCGETALSNAKHSMVTMIQVYEYYISHNLTKAFESLFGAVTCLPGCFSMYRIRASETGKPLFVSKEVVEGYSVNRVDTLHTKNLLHLGEDRYLTTLLLKHHSKYKTKYIFRAYAETIAPDSWKVFLSQRRRWINSTVHNLIELMPMQQLCGFCCFSMRFIVFLDLLSTIVQPVLLGYIVYLIYLLVVSTSTVVPMTAFILLGAIYGLQAIIFIVRRKWEMVGWMIIYVIATPIFSFALPLYAFWHMDEFSWGSTRIVMGEKGEKVVLSDEGKFDPASIPKKRWEEYQAELWEEMNSLHSQHHRDNRSQTGVWRDDYSEMSVPRTHTGMHTPRSEMAYSRPVSQLDLTRNPATSRLSMAPSAAYAALTGEHPVSGYASNSNLASVQQQHQNPQQPPIDLRSMSGAGSAVDLTTADNSQHITDDMLFGEIRDILSTTDWMQVTKKSIRNELERRFGVSLSARKEFIANAIDSLLPRQ